MQGKVIEGFPSSRMPAPAPQIGYTQEMYDENVGGFRNVVDQDQADTLTSRRSQLRTLIACMRLAFQDDRRDSGSSGTDPKLAARTNQLIQNEYEDLLAIENNKQGIKQIDAWLFWNSKNYRQRSFTIAKASRHWRSAS